MKFAPAFPRALVALLISGFATPALADDPAFRFEEAAAPVEESVYTAAVNVGFLLLSGNTNLLTFSGGASFSWADKDNKLGLEASGAYSQAQYLVAVDLNEDGVIQLRELFPKAQVSAGNFAGSGRYDRFFGPRNSAYLSGNGGFDIPGGLAAYFGGQIGYSRALIESEPHKVMAEIGYDLRHESYVLEGTTPLNIHSGRLFVGYDLQLAQDIFAYTSVEVLTNFNSLVTPTGDITPFTDTRVIWKAGLTAKVWKNISARFNFKAKYDHWPAPRPAFDLPFADGVVVPAEKLDTMAEIALIVNFL